MENVDQQPHIRLSKGQVCPVVLTMGDPHRLEIVKSVCDDFIPLAFNREYRSATAVFRGQKFTVISHGIGASGAMLCFEELIALGAKVIIRAGTCGSLKPDKVRTGDVFVPFAMARDPDVTDMYVDVRMPAVGTPRIFNMMMECGKELGVKLHHGIGLSNGVFYGYGSQLMDSLKKWCTLADVVEFEVAALFLVGLARNIETGAILTVDGSPIDRGNVFQDSNYSPTGKECEEGKRQMMRICAATCAKLSREYATSNGH